MANFHEQRVCIKFCFKEGKLASARRLQKLIKCLNKHCVKLDERFVRENLPFQNGKWYVWYTYENACNKETYSYHLASRYTNVWWLHWCIIGEWWMLFFLAADADTTSGLSCGTSGTFGTSFLGYVYYSSWRYTNFSIFYYSVLHHICILFLLIPNLYNIHPLLLHISIQHRTL